MGCELNELQWNRFIGIDYSGAGAPDSGQKGLRVYLATGEEPPQEVLPPAGRSKYWSRQGVALWLEARLREPVPALVALDHNFSFPLEYFERHHLSGDWGDFLADFAAHWPTDRHAVQAVRDGLFGNGVARTGEARWRRLAERRTRAKSAFHFDVEGSVAKSSHAGLPWLLQLRRNLGSAVHFWPYDGWRPELGRSLVAESYPALWNRDEPRQERTADQHDAWTLARWLSRTAHAGRMEEFLVPELESDERRRAAVEGWILGLG